jgi:hypothetical protein
VTILYLIQEKKGGMSVELDNDVAYPMRRVGSIYFEMPLGDVIELSDILFVYGFINNILSISCMTDVQWRVAFEGHQCTINSSLASPRTLAREVREGGLYKLLVNLVTHVHYIERLDEYSSFLDA